MLVSNSLTVRLAVLTKTEVHASKLLCFLVQPVFLQRRIKNCQLIGIRDKVNWNRWPQCGLIEL